MHWWLLQRQTHLADDPLASAPQWQALIGIDKERTKHTQLQEFCNWTNDWVPGCRLSEQNAVRTMPTIWQYLYTQRYRAAQLGLCQLFCRWCTGKYEGRHYVGDLVKNKTCNCFSAQSASFNLTMKDTFSLPQSSILQCHDEGGNNREKQWNRAWDEVAAEEGGSSKILAVWIFVGL